MTDTPYFLRNPYTVGTDAIGNILPQAITLSTLSVLGSMVKSARTLVTEIGHILASARHLRSFHLMYKNS